MLYYVTLCYMLCYVCAISCHDMLFVPYHVMICYAMSYHVMSRYVVILCYVICCFVMPYHVMLLCHVMYVFLFGNDGCRCPTAW